MTVPNAERAIIAVEKLTEYLLNMSQQARRREGKASPATGIGPMLHACWSRT
jgi:hypothetical protein